LAIQRFTSKTKKFIVKINFSPPLSDIWSSKYPTWTPWPILKWFQP